RGVPPRGAGRGFPQRRAPVRMSDRRARGLIQKSPYWDASQNRHNAAWIGACRPATAGPWISVVPGQEGMSISAGQHTAGHTAGKAHPAAPQRAARDRRVEEAFTQARRHSGRVRMLKFVLPLAAVAMIAAFAARSWLAAPGNLPVDL